MKKRKIIRLLGILFSIILLTTLSPNQALAKEGYINTATADDGYFSVYYEDNPGVKMKVAVIYNNQTTYYDCYSNQKYSYAFANGNGAYTIILYRHTSGNLYRKVDSEIVTVKLENVFSPFLVSVYDANFSTGDKVFMTAKNLCKFSKSDSSKIKQIHTYIYENIRYNNYLAQSISAGKVKSYIPNPLTILKTGRGVCYDRASLFAAMCRSQNIPCKIVKGYNDNGLYHAWNEVYVNNKWQKIDVGYSPSKYTY